MARLPVDIIYLILTEVELCESKETLLACSLVSRAWLSPSRSHLFRAVKIHGWQTSFTAFDEFLGAARHVSEYIRDLALAGDYRILTPGSVDPHMVTAYDTPLEVETVHSLLLKLPALRRLHLEYLRLVGSRLIRVQDRRPPLVSLTVEGVPTTSHPHSNLLGLLQIVGLFSSIGVLEVVSGNATAETETGSEGLPDDEHISLACPVHIHALILNQVSHKVLAILLRAIGERNCASASLDSLSIALGGACEAVDVVNDYLRASGSLIKRLSIDHSSLFGHRGHTGEQLQQTSANIPLTPPLVIIGNLIKIPLSMCLNLTSLTLPLHGWLVGGRDQARFTDHCVRVCAELLGPERPLPALEQISLLLAFFHAHEAIYYKLDNAHVAILDRAISDVPTLKACTFVASFLVDTVKSGPEFERTGEALMQQLPKFREKGGVTKVQHVLVGTSLCGRCSALSQTRPSHDRANMFQELGPDRYRDGTFPSRDRLTAAT